MIEKRTASHHYHYTYDALDRLLEARKFAVESTASLSEPELLAQATQALQPDFTLKPLHTTRFAYDLLGNLVQEVAVDEGALLQATRHLSYFLPLPDLRRRMIWESLALRLRVRPSGLPHGETG